jgi:predicted AAA+ superfamily ATPase
MITRIAQPKLLDLASKFKCVAVTGARQCGKTTLVKQAFRQLPYVSLENLDTRQFALEDPRGFLSGYPEGAIFDEVQRVPELFSYMQEFLDNTDKKGFYILSGSNNFLLQESISQSLAGRVGYLNLLPFSLSELASFGELPASDLTLMIKGFYPPVYDQRIPPSDWCPNYLRTYIERDVRQIKNISDLIRFEQFIRLLAARHGQELNNSALSVELGVDIKTVQSWVGILESSFVIYLLRPHHRNFNKIIIKRPKIYFYDPALVCYLLGISQESQLDGHPAKGALFEGMVITEYVKWRTNRGLNVNLFYWRDKTGHEVDLIIDEGQRLIPVEIKSGKTVTKHYFKNLDYWLRLSQERNGWVLFSGDQVQTRSNGVVVENWRTHLMTDR